MSLAKIKEIAKKLFAKVHNLRIATTSLIKKQYPKFRASNREHWELLILKLLGRDRKANKPSTPYQQIQKAASDLYKYGIYIGRFDFLLGVSCTFNQNGSLRGTIGYSETKQSFYYSIGRNGSNRYVTNLDQAIRGLFPKIYSESEAA
jgi:hypothetical protein